ncbi:hypothetical protein [Sphingobium sp. AP50]|uniref:hypothetical protein n=1 Tax=Sphingobium sp. AP50 TaxID=1884369 RepID=UPI00210F0DB9|nr:hypothetical protein [Sphingobium sp. AP50]
MQGVEQPAIAAPARSDLSQQRSGRRIDMQPALRRIVELKPQHGQRTIIVTRVAGRIPIAIRLLQQSHIGQRRARHCMARHGDDAIAAERHGPGGCAIQQVRPFPAPQGDDRLPTQPAKAAFAHASPRLR